MRIISTGLLLLLAVSIKPASSREIINSRDDDGKYLETIKVSDNIYVFKPRIDWSHGNGVAIIGPQGVFFVDTYAQSNYAEEAIRRLRRITPLPVQQVLNTHWHNDHVSGNGVFRVKFPSARFISHDSTAAYMLKIVKPAIDTETKAFKPVVDLLKEEIRDGKRKNGTPIVGNMKPFWDLQLREAEEYIATFHEYPFVPSDVTFADSLVVPWGKQTLKLLYLKDNGHSEGDVIVWIPETRVLITGDIVVLPTPYESQSNAPGLINSLSTLIAMKPAIVIPGHGEVQHDDKKMRLLRSAFTAYQQGTEQAIRAGTPVREALNTIKFPEIDRQFTGDGDDMRKWAYKAFFTNDVIYHGYQKANALKPATVAENAAPAASAAPQPSTTAQTRALPEDVEKRLQLWLERAEPFGITGSVAVLRDTTVSLIAGFGPLGSAPGRIGPDTPFILASLSKQFTAAAIVYEAAAGKLALTDSIGKFFPNAPAATRNITVQQLLTHTGGMVYLEPHMFDPAPDRQALMQEMLSLPLDFAPGARWSYSNPGYVVLGGILEKVEGRSFEAILADRIFRPAGMTATTFVGRDVAGAPDGFQLGENQGPMSSMPGNDRAIGNGSVVSTARDLAKWEVALRTNRIFDARWTGELFKPRVPAAGGAQYAFGWNVLPTPRGTTLLFHAGDLGPFNTEFRRYVDDKFTLIWLSNARLAGGGTRSIVTRVTANLLNGTPLTMPPATKTRDETNERTVAGQYVLPAGDTLVLTSTARGLSVAASGIAGVNTLAGGNVNAALGDSLANAVAALQRGDSATFRARLHSSISPGGAIAGTLRFLNSVADSIGAPLRFESLGAVTSEANAATAWVRIRGSRTSLIVSYGLSGGRITQFGNPGAYAAGMQLRAAAESANEFVAYDVGAMRTTRLSFEGRNVKVSVGEAAPVVARKV